jgi:hypothetical protein
MSVLWAMAVFAVSNAEVLSSEYRAVTIETGQRRLFQVPNLGTVTGASGRCLEEGLDTEGFDTLWVEAQCSGIRTVIAWKKDGTRIHLMACGEDTEKRPPDLLKLRQKVQSELKGSKSMTACIRNGRVELWGWFINEADGALAEALQKRHERVRSFVEKLKVNE